MNLKEIRWKQRFENFDKAFSFLEKSLKKKSFSRLEAGGLIKYFELAFELSWKTLKDYLEMAGIETKFPRDVIKEAFAAEIIEDGQTWMLMLDKRNEFSHTYDEKEARKMVEQIKLSYFKPLKQVYIFLKQKHNE